MRNFVLLFAALGVFAFASSPLTPAFAQSSRTWVSGAGTDSGSCSRAAACASFAYAITQTNAGGEINCLDSGGYGGLTITKAIIISCQAGTAGVLVAGTNAIVISAGATDVVQLDGLDIEGNGTGINGVQVTAAAAVRITNGIIRGFQTNSSNAVMVAPSSGTVQFIMDNVAVNENGGPSDGNAILIQPTGGAKVNATLTNVRLTNNNGAGIRLDGTGGPITAEVRNSVSSNGLRAGISAIGANTVNVLSDGSAFTANGTGVAVNGTGALIRLTRSAVTGNGTGLRITSGIIASYGDNEIDNNTSDGPAPSSVLHK